MQRYGRPESRFPIPSASSVSNKTITRVSTRQTRIALALGVICLHEAAKTLVTQQTQARAQAIAHKLTRREELYKACIKAASKLYADALVHEISNTSKLVALYTMISEM